MQHVTAVRQLQVEVDALGAAAIDKEAYTGMEEYLEARSASVQGWNGGGIGLDLDAPGFWTSWAAGNFPNRTFVGDIAYRKTPGGWPVFNTVSQVHALNAVEANGTAFHRRSDTAALLCQGGTALCLYRCDPMQFREALIMESAVAALSMPSGIPFTPMQACVKGQGGDAAGWDRCWKSRAALQQLFRMLTVAEGVVMARPDGPVPAVAFAPHLKTPPADGSGVLLLKKVTWEDVLRMQYGL